MPASTTSSSARTSASRPSNASASLRRCSRTRSATARSRRCWPTAASPRSCATSSTKSGSSARASSPEATIVFNSPQQYRRIIDRMVHGVGRRVDESSPMVDARLADGSRINAIVPPLALHGPVLTIRKFPERALVMQDLIGLGSLSMDSAVFLEALVRGKISLIVVGGTGTGKTTMLNVLSNYIPDGERLITIEESAELQIQGEHVVTLETRPANAEGTGEVRIRDLVRNSLRMRPDRIIVGECRGAETLDMLQAMNTGHAGSMTTVHANTPRELLGRLETMVMMGGVELPQRAIREQIVMAIGCLVQLQRTPAGPRVVHSITEIQGMEGDTVLLQDIFHRVDMHEGFGRLVPTGLRPKILDELGLNGVEVPAHIFRNDDEPLLNSGWSVGPPSPALAAGTGGRTTLRGALRDAGAPPGREVSTMTLAAMSTQASAFVAAVLVGGGLALGRRRHDHAGAHQATHAGPDPRRHHGDGGGPGRSGLRVSRAWRALGAHGPHRRNLRTDRHIRCSRATSGTGVHPVACGRVPRHQLRHRVRHGRRGRRDHRVADRLRRRHRSGGRGRVVLAEQACGETDQADTGAAARRAVADVGVGRRRSDLPARHRHVPARRQSPTVRTSSTG